MALVKTSITVTDKSTKWGFVLVGDEVGAVVKSYQITAAEAQAVHDGKALPPGVNAATWATGKVYVASRPCLALQAVVESNGWLVANYKVDTSVANKLDALVMRIPPTQWELRNGTEVWIESTVAPAAIVRA